MVGRAWSSFVGAGTTRFAGYLCALRQSGQLQGNFKVHRNQVATIFPAIQFFDQPSCAGPNQILPAVKEINLHS